LLSLFYDLIVSAHRGLSCVVQNADKLLTRLHPGPTPADI